MNYGYDVSFTTTGTVKQVGNNLRAGIINDR